MATNRWGADIRPGMVVSVQGVSGSYVASVERIQKPDAFSRAYGRQATLDNGASHCVDDLRVIASSSQIQVMADHYVIAALWADSPEGTNPRATKAARRIALARCRHFVEMIGPLFNRAIACEGYGSHPDCGTVHPACAAMGHDLYLTCAGHGVGFWDRDELGALGDKLSAFCGWRGPMGEPNADFYRGWLYFNPGRADQ